MMQHLKAVSLVLIVFCFSLICISCNKEDQFTDLQNYIKQLKTSDSHSANTPIPEITLPTPAQYQADLLRSPFEAPPESTSKANAIKTNPLQAYPINMLRFIGTLTKGNTTYGFIITPDNLIYQVEEGDLIGERGNKVISIYPDKMNIMEEQKNAIYGSKPIQRIITLQLEDAP